MRISLLLLVSLLLLCSNFAIIWPSTALPLHTNSRWIVDEGGRRVKLACMNWASHLEVVAAEGLSKQPLDVISKRIAATGFNCVRLTWPLFMVTNSTLGSLTLRKSLQNLGLVESISGVQAKNPGLLDLPVLQVFQAVVSNLGDNNIMVILDNHISKPGWCCSQQDDSGFFGDRYFNPDLWLNGLTKMATIFNTTTNVVAMSLRNELRGPRQNVSAWYRYMQKGAEAVHSANPNVLVIVSGLSFDTDLSFLSNKQLDLTFTGKLVFEMHWYGFSDGKAWENGNLNQVCGSIASNVMRRGGFLLDQGWPLFFSEFGVDERGINVNDNRFLNCFCGVAAELDLDWALWALQGSYYLREGTIGLDEKYGLLDWSWCQLRNSSFLQRLSALQSPFQGPGISSGRPYKIIFHPSTGLCVIRKSLIQPLKLGPCDQTEAWSYSPQKTLVIKGTYFCLQVDGLGKPAKLGIICSTANSKWEPISDSKMHLSSMLTDGTTVCLDIDSDNTLITNLCKCLERDQSCDPSSQWFKIIDSTRRLAAGNLPEILRTNPLHWNTSTSYDRRLEIGHGQVEGRSSQ